MAADDSETRKQGDAQASAAQTALSFFALRPWEWVIAGVVTSMIVIVNKAVIHDRGNSWATLLVLSLFAGIVVSHSARCMRERH